MGAGRGGGGGGKVGSRITFYCGLLGVGAVNVEDGTIAVLLVESICHRQSSQGPCRIKGRSES